MPDAFICANDNIAAGLMDEAICFNPQITTVSHKREILAGHCMELFDKIWRGRPVEQCHYIEPEISYTESCGCPFLTLIDYREGARRNITENAVGAFRFLAAMNLLFFIHSRIRRQNIKKAGTKESRKQGR